MIPLEKEIMIRQLLAEGNLSQRRIGHITGVSRGTIGNIANGKYTTRTRSQSDEEYLALHDGPVERCPICRRKVYMPCIACRTREWMKLEGKVA